MKARAVLATAPQKGKLSSALRGGREQRVKLSFGRVSGDLDSTEGVCRARGREAGAVLGEDDLEALQQPG
jgi:hypothetical protein